ncbi:MAG: hypothetical protein EBY89_02015, partial [Actinobacteria bacterium]|nr:hypothetical protein [Actinomycetota bacterium]
YADARRTIDDAYRDAVKAAIDARKTAIQADSSKTARQAAQVVFTTAVADAQAVFTYSLSAARYSRIAAITAFVASPREPAFGDTTVVVVEPDASSARTGDALSRPSVAVATITATGRMERFMMRVSFVGAR